MNQAPVPPDVAAVLEALRAEVRVQRMLLATEEADPALASIERELRHCAEQLEVTRVVSAHWPIEGGNLYTRAWAFLHKVVRRGLSWYIPPIVAQQNGFNDAAAQTLTQLIRSNLELRRQIAALGASSAPPPTPTGAAPRPDPPAATTDPPVATTAARAQAQTEVSAHQQLGTTPSALAQRGIRQYLRWMINPIVEQQNAANTALADALPLLIANEAALRERLAAQRESC